ncbi:caveolae-associated protein 4a [Lepisosteus oculatus]|uniref:Muscle-restricted coiled-coil protein n=1 Tax=Lepisosteus oculatus TaxID=7918 RepID=W5N4W9_LEPOC|nr:PREDICTED: muscle-related coiled-coil protein [Lepisosteus oculatus]
MDQQQFQAVAADKLEVTGTGEDEAGAPISTLTILSLLERVAGIIDNVQACQQRMEERQLELENNIKTIQIDVLKLAKDHSITGNTVEKLLEKTRKVSSNVKDVRQRVEKQNIRVKKVEATQEELLMRNKFRVVIYQGETEIPSVAVTKTPKGAPGVSTVEPDTYDAPADLSSDEEYMVVEEADSSTAARLKKSGMRRIESIKKAFTKENMTKTKQNLGTKVNQISTRIVTPERREKIRQSGERIKHSGERLKESISKAAPTKESFKFSIKKDKERTVAEGQEGTQGAHAEQAAEESGASAPPPKASRKPNPDVTYTEVVTEVKQETSVTELAAPQREDGKLPYTETIVIAAEEGKGEQAEGVVNDIKQSSQAV